MSRHRSLSLARPFAATALLGLLVAAGCSSSDGGGTGGTGGSASTGGAGGRGGSGGSGGTTGGTTGGSGGATGGSGGGSALATYKTCDRDKLQGDFVIAGDADNNFTSIEGRVMNGVEQVRQVKLVKQVGDCRILQPPEAFICTPQCDVANQQCTPTGCTAKPRAQNLGTVTVSGLKTGTNTLMQIDGIYNNAGSLPHPAFDEGADITVQATGNAGWGPFTLKGWGLAPLVVPTTPVMVKMGQAVTLTWTPPGKPGPTKVLIDFSINRHGAVDSWLECAVPDTGSFTVTAEMVTELFKNGVSGFPSVNLTRQSGDITTVMGGCTQLLVTSPVSRDLTVEGVVSCNDDKPCPGGKVCRDDLTCPP